MATNPDLTPRQSMLLLLISKADAPGLDPIRIMKGQFLLAMEVPAHWMRAEARYAFVPYNYGPYSSEIYRDLDLLEQMNLIGRTTLPGRSWSYYYSTEAGTACADEIASTLEPALVKYIDSVRHFVSSVSFSDLLRAVYQRYPEYAVNSVFAAPAPAA